MNKEKREYLRQNKSLVFNIIGNITIILSIIIGVYVGFQYGFWMGVLAFILAVVLFYIYFLPTHIASMKDHHHTTVICLLNILITNWPLLLIWALCLKNEVPKGYILFEPKSITEKIDESINIFDDNIDKIDKNLDIKVNNFIKKHKEERELNPKKYKKIDQFTKLSSYILLALILSTAIFFIFDARIHNDNTDNIDFYTQAKLNSEEGDGYVDEFASAQKDGKYGFVNEKNNFVVKPIYAKTQNIEGEYFFVCNDQKGEKCAYMNKKTEKLLTDFKYIGCGNSWRSDSFSEGLAMVVVGESDNFRVGYIDETGKETIFPKYSDGKRFKDGVAEVYLADKLMRIDKNGNVLK